MIKKYWILLLFSFIGCATTTQRKGIYPTITYFVGSTDVAKYKRVAVLPFSDAPYAPQSGQIIQGLTSQILAQLGFEVVERTRLMDILQEQKMDSLGFFDTDQSIKLGKILGVRAVVVGEVGQYMTQQRKTDTTYFPWTNFYTGQTVSIPIQGKQWMESYVSLSLRVLDVETGSLIYSGSGQYSQGLTNPPQQLAENILGGILSKWIISRGIESASEKIGEKQALMSELFNRASEFYKEGKYREAIARWEEVLKLDPDHSLSKEKIKQAKKKLKEKEFEEIKWKD